MRRSAFVISVAALAASQAWGIYGINTGPGSSDSTFTWVGSANGASGVVIDPHWVLTAGHVGGNTFTLDGTTYTADNTVASSSYDLYLMHFANPFGGSYQLYSGSIIGQQVTMVGFGDSGSLRADGLGYDEQGAGGTRRSATNVIGLEQSLAFNSWNTPSLIADLDAAAGNNLAAPWNRDWFGDGFATSNEGGLMAGDSGGGWFINVGGTQQLVGISNYIGWDDTTFPNESHYYEFGVSFNSAADLTDPGVRSWVASTVPEPASTAAILVGLVGLLARKRRGLR